MQQALKSLKEHAACRLAGWHPAGCCNTVPVGFDDTNPTASRARLAGAFARSSDGKFFAFLIGPSVH